MTRRPLRALAACGVALAVLLSGCAQAGSPDLTLTDRVSGEPIGVTCVDVPEPDCEVATAAMLDYLPADAARVEGVRVEPMTEPPSDADLAVRVTLDHEMFLQAGEQAYSVVRRTGSEDVEIESLRE